MQRQKTQMRKTLSLLTPASVAFNSVFIPSTDAQARRDATAEGRVDPFADVPFQVDVEFLPEPPPEPKPIAAAPQNVPTVSSPTASTPTPPKTPAPVTPNSSSAPANGGASSNGGSVNDGDGINTVPTLDAPGEIRTALDFAPVLPQVPTADLAEDTKITGVITLNGVDNIMVKAPNEEYSRYVQVGDVIAGGQVTVKRVDFRRNSPVVVLEQFGVEVYKDVVDDILIADRDGDSGSPETEASES